jgi:predicted nucleic acid-binding protein
MKGSFLDTNILIYLAKNDVDKADRAESLVTPEAIISVQVLNEFADVTRRKLHWDWPDIDRFADLLRGVVHVEPLTVATYDAGFGVAVRYGLSIYDSMIVAAALESGCETLYSEDMHHGMVVDGRLTIVNPFL